MACLNFETILISRHKKQKPLLGKWKKLTMWRVLPRINFSFHPYQDMRKETNLQQWVAVCKKYESLQPSQSVLEEKKCSQQYSKYRAKEFMDSSRKSKICVQWNKSHDCDLLRCDLYEQLLMGERNYITKLSIVDITHPLFHLLLLFLKNIL